VTTTGGDRFGSLLSRTLRAAGGALLEIAVPRRCGLCGRFDTFLCDGCRATLLPAEPPRCPTCWGVPDARGRCRFCASVLVQPLDGARGTYRLEDGARRLVHAVKYDGLFALAEPMADLMTDTLRSWGIAPDVIAPVPLHPSRQRQRGFNQAALLARRVGANVGLPVETKLLRRVRRTTPQVRTAGADERQRNVAGAFTAPPGAASGAAVLLIDDVTTTGTTLRACADALRTAGCRRVYALTFARED
jgi:ComF family protein